MSKAVHIYKSKQGLVSYIVICILAVLISIQFYAGKYWNGIFILAVIAIAILPMLLNTSYTITENAQLRIRCGWIVNIKMNIESIRKIENTRSILSSPALSMDRIEIFYNKFDSVMVSPKDKAQFVAQLQLIKPSIEYQVFNQD